MFFLEDGSPDRAKVKKLYGGEHEYQSQNNKSSANQDRLEAYLGEICRVGTAHQKSQPE